MGSTPKSHIHIYLQPTIHNFLQWLANHSRPNKNTANTIEIEKYPHYPKSNSPKHTHTHIQSVSSIETIQDNINNPSSKLNIKSTIYP
jgi:hypothetical protein